MVGLRYACSCCEIDQTYWENRVIQCFSFLWQNAQNIDVINADIIWKWTPISWPYLPLNCPTLIKHIQFLLLLNLCIILLKKKNKKKKYSQTLCNPIHFPRSLGYQIRQLPLYILSSTDKLLRNILCGIHLNYDK